METETMRTEYVQAVLSGFDGVWQRVTGQEPPTKKEHGSNAGSLAFFAREEARAAAYDRELARCFTGTGRAALLAHAAQASQRALRLRAEVFLLTGERTDSEASCPCFRGALSALRDAMLRDQAAAEAYDKADGDDGCGLGEQLRDYACQRRAAAREKRALILRCFR